MLTPKHLSELLASGIGPELAALNFESVSGSDVYSYLCYSEKLERRNDGRLAQKWLNRYRHCESGGWRGSGLDPLNNWQPMEWGCFKPDQPKEDYQKSGAFIKYEHPAKIQTRAFFFQPCFSQSWQITRKQGGKVIERLGSLSDGKGFWESVVKDKNVPITVCEGAKKAASLLNAGHAAVGLPGVTGAVRVPKDEQGNQIGKPYLIPEIELLATPGREIFICFDQDEKTKTVQNVSREIFKLGRLFESKKCHVKVIEWDSALGKGVDDLIFNHGVKAFDAAYQKALLFESWLVRHYNQLTYAPQLTVNKRYLGNIEVPHDEKLICFRSAKNTGKTETTAQLASEALANGQRVLLISHRIQLTQALCDRVGIQSIYELRAAREKDKKIGRESEVVAQFQGIGLCVDSLHPYSQARFEAQDWKDALIILDEVEQLFWHGLNSSTCQSDRVAILRELKELLSLALHPNSEGRVILSDADLTDVAVDFVLETAGQSELVPWVCVNEYRPEQAWNTHTYIGKKEEWLIGLERHIKDGGRPLIMLDSQKLKARFSSSNMETYLKGLFPTLRILRIDRQTLQLKSHPAFGCISRLNTLLSEYDIVITSPSVETGVSIDIKGHFTSVWGLFAGVLPANSVRQTLARLREPVDRHIWLAPYGLGRIGRGETSVKALLQSENKIVRANLHSIYDSCLDNGDVDVDFLQSALDCWAKMAVRINAGMAAYRDSITKDLEDEGHKICPVLDDVSDRALQTKKTALTANRDLNQAEWGAKLEAAQLITETEARILEDSPSLESEGQQLRLQKYKLHNRYGGVNVDSELYLRDCAGWYPKIRLHYFLSIGNQHLKQRDRSRRDELVNDNRGWTPDLNRNLLSVQIKLLNFLGFPELLEAKKEGVWISSDPELLEFKKQVVANREAVIKILGFSVKDSMTPIQIVRPFLNEIGVVFKAVGKQGKRGEQERAYRLKTAGDYYEVGAFTNVFALDDGRDAIFAKWIERDEAKAVKAQAKVSPQTPFQDSVSNSDTVSTDGKYISITSTGYQTSGYQNPPQDSVSNPDTVSTDGKYISITSTGYQPVDTKPVDTKPVDTKPVDTKPVDTTQQEKEETSPTNKEGGWAVGQRVRAWLGVKQSWEEATILQIEANPTRRFFKAVVQFFNLGGAIQYIWEPGWLASS